jgi:hypothetical protein
LVDGGDGEEEEAVPEDDATKGGRIGGLFKKKGKEGKEGKEQSGKMTSGKEGREGKEGKEGKDGKEGREGSAQGSAKGDFDERSVEGAVRLKEKNILGFLFKNKRAEGEGRVDTLSVHELEREEDQLIEEIHLEDELAERRFKDFDELLRVQARFVQERKQLQRTELRRFLSNIFIELKKMENDRRKLEAEGSLLNQLGSMFRAREEAHDFHDDHHSHPTYNQQHLDPHHQEDEKTCTNACEIS